MRGKTEKITKMILKSLLVSGAVAVASTSPYFLSRALPELFKYLSHKRERKKRDTKFYNSFYYLKKQGLLDFQYEGKQLYVSLSKEGKKKAREFSFDDLKIRKPKKWDGKWRILIFDIKNNQRAKREALRGKIKELGLFQLQKSVWAHPYDFKAEANFMKDFFGFKDDEVKIIIARDIENDREIKKYFNIG